MLIAKQSETPVMLTSTTHTLTDALAAATLKNQGNKKIIGYRIGWATVVAGKPGFKAGPWMNLPAGIDPGTAVSVPAQSIAIDSHADRMIFYVVEAKFSDGTHWKSNRKSITPSIK
jgi:hypothetical protein